MKFQEVFQQAVIWLRRDKRISYLALKRQFAIDAPYVDDLKEAILYAHPRFVKDDGRGLTWTAEAETPDPSARHGTDTQVRVEALLPVVTMLLERETRVAYTDLKVIFGIDDELLSALSQELRFRKVARDTQTASLVWAGDVHSGEKHSTIPLITSDPTGVRGVPSPVSTLPGLPYPEAARPIAPIPTASVAEPIDSLSERRHLTVMFCDIAESTKLSGQLDPEDLREIIRAYQATAATVIQHYESYIAQHLGDGLLVYFGWPQAHEDDTQRAVYTGLGIIDAITTSLNTRLEAEKGVRLAVRVGIHTGPVVVGEMCSGARCERLATGETVNIAAHIQGIAAPNSVVVSSATSHMVKAAFDLEDLGPQDLKGVAQPMRVFCVQGAIQGDTKNHQDASGKAPFLVGRDKEIGLLIRRWEQSQEGAGQVVLISGEAGIGKSALVDGLYAQLADAAATRITFRCSQHHRNSALYPVITHIEYVFGFTREDTADLKVGKMERILKRSGLPLLEGMPLLAALLSVPLPEDRYPKMNFSAQRQRKQTKDLLAAWLRTESERLPVLVVWTDLQWADASTLELLELFVAQAPTVKMLHVLTFRPEFVPPWTHRSHMTPIDINPLEKRQAEALIRHLAGGLDLPQEVVEHIATKTDGVPLYVEEFTKTVLESRLLRKKADHYVLTGTLSTIAIPTTLHDSLMARLDRVPLAREVAQLGAVLGREFSYDMLQALATVEEPTLLKSLSLLVEHELLYQRGRPPRATYIFKHALVHEAAYRSLLRKTRRHYHLAAAKLMEKQFPELVRTQPEIIAHHYSEADCPGPSIKYWHQAGSRAQHRSAHVEAIAHLTKAHEILTALPETAERTKNELALLLSVGPSLIAIKGYAAQEVEGIYSRARMLCRQMGEPMQKFQTLWGLWGFYLVRANHREARKVGEEIFGLAHGTQDAIYRMVSHLTLGGALFCAAEFVSASEHLEQGAALYDSHQHRSLTSLFAADLGVFCTVWASHPLWHIGYPDRALKRSRVAVKLAETLGHPFSMALAFNYAAILHQFRREAKIAYQLAEAAIIICREQKFAYYLGWAMIIRGWARAQQEDCQAGIAEIQHGLKTLRETGAKRSLPYYLSLLAEAHGRNGQAEEGLQIIADAFVEVKNNGEHWWESELHRLRGTLLLEQPQPDAMQAEASFHQARMIARRQKSLTLELRAAIALHRLWQQQGTRDDAGQSLVEVFNRFTEGFDTPDLKEASGLIDDCAGGSDLKLALPY